MSNAPRTGNESMTAKVQIIENELLKHAQVDIPTHHHFAQDVYAREIFIPKDTLLTGKVHKYSQVNIIAKGEISVLTESGVRRLAAPSVLVSPPGTKRVGYAHEDTVWITVHGTNETDVELIERTFIAKDEQEYLTHCNELLLGGA